MKDVRRETPVPPPVLFMGRHWAARPLPEPPRVRHVSKIGRPATDPLGILLEEWVAELRIGYTEPGD
jgi:hypothetical protein